MITSITFFIILSASFVLYWIIPIKYKSRSFLLIISSVLFLFFFDRSAVLITLILSTYTYSSGVFLLKQKNKGLIHIISIIGLLLSLALIKYFGLFQTVLQSINEFTRILPSFEMKHILLPLGLSYLVLKHISFLTDIKWGIIKEITIVDFFAYSFLFTIFTAGPIERYERLQPQLDNREMKFKWSFVDEGFRRIVFGLFKKLVIADWIAYFINPVLQNRNEYPMYIQILALLGFSFQIYFDFSGYSDIAIGSSRLFGLKIIENFDYPYLKRNISQFWRSWHISLSDWIRDYLFMPLAKLFDNKIWLFIFVPLISMGLCGLWHGAKWDFILWGLWHGLGISIYRVFTYYEKRNESIRKISKSIFIKPVSIILTFLFITVGWIWFI
ncbi:MAG: MBOAT family O-acyltransferase [Ignavibacteria bacterium]